MASWVTVQNWEAPFQTTSGSAYNTSTALTDVAPSAGLEQVMPGSSMFVGQLFRFTARGIFSTSATPNLTLGVYLGTPGTISGATALATTGTVATLSGAANNVWELEAISRVATLGSSGTILTLGSVSGISATTAVNMMPATSSNGGSATINTTSALGFMLGATWGTNSSANTLTCYHFLVEALTTV